jgi:hypothetical protein
MHGSGSSAACKRNAQPLGTPDTPVPYREGQGFGLIYGPPGVAPGSIDIEKIPPSEVGPVVYSKPHFFPPNFAFGATKHNE